MITRSKRKQIKSVKKPRERMMKPKEKAKPRTLLNHLIARECTVHETKVVEPQRNKMDLPKLTESDVPPAFLTSLEQALIFNEKLRINWAKVLPL